eukprot:GHVT01037232.1.p1 GENE.GHVT01037232.1~~GHVT01037232.1.p1  ORF type:complete len:494 (+),score=54.20 GHVT01037232.1:651-2132(+)
MPDLQQALDKRSKHLTEKLKIIAAKIKNVNMSSADIGLSVNTELKGFVELNTEDMPLEKIVTILGKLLALEGSSTVASCQTIISDAENKRNTWFAEKWKTIETELKKDNASPADILVNIKKQLPGYVGAVNIDDIERATNLFIETVRKESTLFKRGNMTNPTKFFGERLNKLKGKLETIAAELKKIDKTPADTIGTIQKQLPGYVDISNAANISAAINLIQDVVSNEQKILAGECKARFDQALKTRVTALKTLFNSLGNLIKDLNKTPQNINDQINEKWNRYSSQITFQSLSDTSTAVVAALEKEDVAAKLECKTKILDAEQDRQQQLKQKLGELCQKIGEPTMTPGELKTQITTIFQGTYIAVVNGGATLIEIRQNVEAHISQDSTAVVDFVKNMACSAFVVRKKSVNGGTFFAWDGQTFVAALTKDIPVEFGPANDYVKRAASGEWVNMEQHPADNLPAVLPPFLRYSLKYGAPQGDTKVSEIIQSPVNGT